jgi:uroporphyrin-III C-methyltransferase
VLRGLLAGLPELVEREAVQSPALIVIGEVTARLQRHPDESQDRIELGALLQAIPGHARDDGENA